VLRIHLILMRILMQILDPHWKKNGSGSRLWIFLYYLLNLFDKAIFKITFLFFSLIFINLMNHSEMIQFFLQFWLIFLPLDPDPWIRIFFRIRIQSPRFNNWNPTLRPNLRPNSDSLCHQTLDSTTLKFFINATVLRNHLWLTFNVLSVVKVN